VQRDELEHLIRAAARITDEYEFVIVGSQSILGSIERPPVECMVSNEADIFPMHAEGKADWIDGVIGEGSQFHETFGYYAQGVDSTTAKLPAGWRERLVRVQSEQTEGRVGYCLDVLDLFLSKCAANREKDRVFNRALLAHRHITVEKALERLPDMPLDDNRKATIALLIQRLAREAGV
jgi:hypothetical protein